MNTIPSKITAGTTLDLRLTLAAFLAPDWSASLILRGPSQITITGTADGAQHRLAKSATDTADWTKGFYAYALRVERDGEVVEVETGTLEVLPDLAAITSPHDATGHLRKVLAAIEAVIEARATTDQMSYKIGNRELQRMPVTDLLKLRSTYQAELRRAEAAARGGSSLLGRTVKVRF